ncbi:PREDICTED: hematopoietically-expressed homeobox protein HHEX [Charadrius vociferus]|uniref:hematopoietically-expressed homeobox protein HHEX n=1 Tax=Charadrius vociferus TaxID=50402 RepID=UPI0005215B58|nr:PREDICTED: hematopoietically-expressed homeobox protein HHEX [Charadrius vociferus]
MLLAVCDSGKAPGTCRLRDYPVPSLVVVAQVKTWFQNRRAKWRRLKQENPQATKKEEVEGADSHSDQRPESCPTPEQKGKEVSLDGSQYTPSPASQEDLESDVSDDSDQEVDIEGDKGYYNPTH